jgi:hypothetical protein
LRIDRIKIPRFRNADVSAIPMRRKWGGRLSVDIRYWPTTPRSRCNERGRRCIASGRWGDGRRTGGPEGDATSCQHRSRSDADLPSPAGLPRKPQTSCDQPRRGPRMKATVLADGIGVFLPPASKSQPHTRRISLTAKPNEIGVHGPSMVGLPDAAMIMRRSGGRPTCSSINWESPQVNKR